MRQGNVAGNGFYPPPAIRSLTGAFEGDRLRGSLQLNGKIIDTLMRRAVMDRYILSEPTALEAPKSILIENDI